MNSTALPNGLSISHINSYETKFLYNEIFVQNVYMNHGIEVHPGNVLIDAGANIGMFAIYMFRKFNPARVFCFEPAPHCLEALRFNLARWKDQAVIIASALGENEGEADFTYYPGYSIMSGLFADRNRDLDVLKTGARTQLARLSEPCDDESMIDVLVEGKLDNAVSFKCPMTTVSSVIENYDLKCVHLLKIDVERAENAILRGIKDEHWARINQIVVEVHDQGAGEHEAMREMLAHKGYQTVLAVEQDLQNSAIYQLTARRQ